MTTRHARLPEEVEDALNRLIISFLADLTAHASESEILGPTSDSSAYNQEDAAAQGEGEVTCTQSFLSTFRTHLHNHLTTLTQLAQRSSAALASSTQPSARDWIRALAQTETTREPYGLQLGSLKQYLRTRDATAASAGGEPASRRRRLMLSTAASASATEAERTAAATASMIPLGRFGSAYGRSHSTRRAEWGPSTEAWLDSEPEDEGMDEHGHGHEMRLQEPGSAKLHASSRKAGGGANWELYPSFSSSSRDQVRPVPHSGLLYKPPKQPLPIFDSSSTTDHHHSQYDTGPDGAPHPSNQLSTILDPDAPAPPIGTIPNPVPPPLPSQLDPHNMLTKQALGYMRALQDVVPAHLPALPPRHTWRRTPFYTSAPPATGAGYGGSTSLSTAVVAGGGGAGTTGGGGSSTLLVDRKLHAARLAQNSLRKLISATEEAAARAAERAMEEREVRARLDGADDGGREVLFLSSSSSQAPGKDVGSGSAGTGGGDDKTGTKVVPVRLTPPASPPHVQASSLQITSVESGGAAQDRQGDAVMAEATPGGGPSVVALAGGGVAVDGDGPRKKRKYPRPPGWGELVL
ncbi:hypothetical protein V8E36_005599 [Tilletia maclaganii]